MSPEAVEALSGFADDVAEAPDPYFLILTGNYVEPHRDSIAGAWKTEQSSQRADGVPYGDPANGAAPARRGMKTAQRRRQSLEIIFE
jgi:hypothetical protein